MSKGETSIEQSNKVEIFEQEVKYAKEKRRLKSIRPNNADGAMCCIVLDHLETYVPTVMSGRTGVNDPAVPTLNAMGKRLFIE